MTWWGLGQAAPSGMIPGETCYPTDAPPAHQRWAEKRGFPPCPERVAVQPVLPVPNARSLDLVAASAPIPAAPSPLADVVSMLSAPVMGPGSPPLGIVVAFFGLVAWKALSRRKKGRRT